MLSQVATHHEAIGEQGWDVIGVAPRAAYQAAALIQRGHPFDLFLDRDRALYASVDARPQSLVNFLFNLPAWWRYVKALARGRRQGRITGHYSNVPAIFLTDQDGLVTRAWLGGALGDYPPLADVLDALG